MNNYIVISINLAFVAVLLLFYFTSTPVDFRKLSDKLNPLVILTNVFLLGWSFAIYTVSSKLNLSENGIVDQTMVDTIQKALLPFTIHYTLPLFSPLIFSRMKYYLNHKNSNIDEVDS